MSTRSIIDYNKSSTTFGAIEESRQTNIPKVPETAKENKFTSLQEWAEERVPLQENGNMFSVYAIKSYSPEYIAYNTKLIIDKLDNELALWQKTNPDDAFPYISNIKDLLEENEEYLTQKDENRLLLSLLELIFQNNNWENIEQEDIKFLRREVIRFKDGNVDWKNLDNFSKQLYRKNLSVFKKSEYNEKKERKD